MMKHGFLYTMNDCGGRPWSTVGSRRLVGEVDRDVESAGV
jgi:hypothetical protein